MQQQFQFAQDPVAALDALIHQALWRPKPGLVLPQKARELLCILMYCKGAEHAKPLAEIAKKLNIREREIKQHARTLTMDFHIPIGASRQRPYGYFLCVTPEDYTSAWRPYIHEAIALLSRAKELQAPQRIIEVLGQLQIELDDEARKVS